MSNVRSAEVVLPCRELAPMLAFFQERLGFRLDAIFPADDPSVARMSGHGLRLRLRRELAPASAPLVLRLVCDDPAALGGGAGVLEAPNGTRIELVADEKTLVVPPARLAFQLTRAGPAAPWIEGRAGMQYRDLLPERLGGHLVASHIRIPAGGTVADYVHYHEVRFQLIYCRRGWVRVVYEDQGEPFVLVEGDCVLQPPRIRHRVLESSPGLEVLELGSPAAHETRVEHELTLPTRELHPERDFGGQRFVRHESRSAPWGAWRLAGFEARDLGLGPATNGLAQASVVRPHPGTDCKDAPGSAPALRFLYVLRGSVVLERAGHGPEALKEDDALLLPAAESHALVEPSRDLELFEVSLAT